MKVLPKNGKKVRSKIGSKYCVSWWHLRQEKHHRSLLYKFHLGCLALIYEQVVDFMSKLWSIIFSQRMWPFYVVGCKILTITNHPKEPKVTLDQNPHQPTPAREKVLEIAIGRATKGFRLQQGITVSDLAKRTGLSKGMLSKIENGNISPSLSTLQSLAIALSVPLTSFLRVFEETRYAVHTKSGDGVETNEAGTRAGHQYKLLGHLKSVSSGVVVEPYLITLTEKSDRFPTFQHDGVETIYMLEGIVEYRHDDQLFRLEPGDTLFFEADAPHGPEILVQLPARFISVISYPRVK